MKFFKTAFAALLCIAAISACTKTDPIEGGNDEPKVEYITELSATIGDYTKAITTFADGKTAFENGDAIVVNNGKANETFTYDASKAKFVTTSTKFEKAETYYAIYPASIFNSASKIPEAVAINIPVEQKATADGVKDSPLCAQSTAGVLAFKPVCTIAKLSIPEAQKGSKLTSAKLVGQTNIAGKMTYNFKDGSYSFDITNPVTEIRLNAAEVDIEGGQSAYMVVAPRTYKDGLTLELSFADGKQVKMESEGSVKLTSGYMLAVDMLTAPDMFSGGTGSAEAPYQISNMQDLVDLCTMSNAAATAADLADKHFVQTADIDMSGAGSFKPMFQATTFAGTYDGANYKIANLKEAPLTSAPAGFFSTVTGATVKNIKFENVSVDGQYAYCAAVAGKATNSTIENIEVSGQVRQYVSGITAEGVANTGFCGGFIGSMNGGILKGCTLAGNVTFYGKYCGGIVGSATDATIEDCHVLPKQTVNLYYHFEGGIVGVAKGAKTLIKGCSFEGNLSSVGYTTGGIVGQLQGGKVQECVLGSYATVGGDKYAVAGIVGHASPVADITIEKCVSYGNVKGCYAVGGIVGYTGSGATAIGGAVSGSTKAVKVIGCAVLGGEITSTGNNGGSNKYTLVAGIAGWTAAGGTVTVESCFVNPTILQSTSGGNRGGVGGLTGYQNNATSATFTNCYTTLCKSNTFSCNDPVAATSSFFCGAIYARATQPTTVSNCFYDAEIGIGPQEGKTTESGCEALTVAQMTDGTLLGKLNSTAAGVKWVAGSNGYPTIEGLPTDPHVKPRAAKRVSVIGDSISTFKGWIPGGYSAHYPAVDGTLTLVNETYWYRLIYDHMKSAEFDTNIAFSGSTVTNTTTANYEARYGTATNAWWHNSFTERFASCGGMGRPDIILIHGGTNDWAHDADPLYPGSPKSKSASTPSDAVLSSIYAVAEAATTRDAINALPDATFCEAYVKLLCQIKERYPKAKVVCIIGDYLSEAFEQSMLKMAEHYGAKTVDLLKVNGFNDQTYMPKHDFNGTSGCHPGSKAMDFIATKIYTELGPWLEQ